MEHGRDFLGQFAGRACHVGPEGPHGEPAMSRAPPVPSPIMNAGGRALMAEPAVQLDENSLLDVGDVVALSPSMC